jgi:DNA primase small subunit
MINHHAELREYYKNFFPYDLIFKWLSTSKPQIYVDGDITKREFAFTFQSGTYSRFNSIQTPQNLYNILVNDSPTRMELGAVYNRQPNMKKEFELFIPIGHELVFDIDITDYDNVRTCCKSKAICDGCFLLLKGSIRMLKHILEGTFPVYVLKSLDWRINYGCLVAGEEFIAG